MLHFCLCFVCAESMMFKSSVNIPSISGSAESLKEESENDFSLQVQMVFNGLWPIKPMVSFEWSLIKLSSRVIKW